MKTLPELLSRRFNGIVFEWLITHRVLFKRLRDHMDFIKMNYDGYVYVKLSFFDERYKQKHINPDPDKYCDEFVKQMRPVLNDVLNSVSQRGHMFPFIFIGAGMALTRFVRIER
jgi:hypothetical protein